MTDASFASLGPTLLARKGGAKPAMRPQLAPLPELKSVDAESFEDLGWNDMGETSPNDNSPIAKKPKGKAAKVPASYKKSAISKKPAKSAKRAAFTLRLDADRHLKLRLAATMRGESAQSLLTDALDMMLGDIEDLDVLAHWMKRN